ncbi:MAG: DNA mismatch repair endonuclease MutL [Thermoplasmata archaeon]
MSSPAPRLPIRRLDAETVRRIAAGEVVERPASVVKELVENAVDAGAAEIIVRLEGGGLRRIEVADDGGGIPADELELAVERHATSKLGTNGSIERIRTLGFRGEALAAIAAVSKFRIRSRTAGATAASGITVAGGETVGRFESGRAVGTTVEVEELFFNTPARRKFLHAPAAEQMEVLRTIDHLYLAHPTVGIWIEVDGREVGAYPATSDLRDAAARVLGPEILHQSFPVDDDLPGGGRVRGVLGRPATAIGHSRGLYLSANGRAIQARTITQAVRASYHDYLPKTRYPIGVLHLELPPERLDVNVHPTKREIRFSRETDIADAVRLAVRRALIGAPPLAELPDGPTSPRALRFPVEGSGADLSWLPPAPRLDAMPATASSSQRRLASLEPPRRLAGSAGGRPQLTLLGCVGALYWIAESEDGLVLVDQHAASERALYDALLREGKLARQELVEPVTVHLTSTQRAALLAHAEAVHSAGFTVEPFGGDAHRLRSVPSWRGGRARADGLAALLDELAAGARPTIPDGARERTAASIACHSAIRAGDPVAPAEMARVLDALYEGAEAVYSCPHGRPVLLQIPRSRLDRWFLRSGP